MNTKNLSRYYNQLAPEERLPLILAALARADEVERKRLQQSAPRRSFTVPDHWGMAEAFLFLSNVYLLHLLETAADYLERFAGAAAAPARRLRSDRDGWEEVLMLGYAFQTAWAGWHQFCAERHLDAEVMWDSLPGWATVQRAAQLSGTRPGQKLPGAAYLPEGAAVYLARAALGDDEAVIDEANRRKYWPATSTDVAAGLGATWEKLLQQWDMPGGREP